MDKQVPARAVRHEAEIAGINNVCKLPQFDAENYRCGPHLVGYGERLLSALRDAIANECWLRPYSDAELHTLLTYNYGIRGLLLPHVEELRARHSIANAADRYDTYWAIVKRNYDKLCKAALKNGADDELDGVKPQDYRQIICWKNAQLVLKHINHTGVFTFDSSFLQSIKPALYGEEKEAALQSAINLCLREKLLVERDGRLEITSAGRDFRSLE